MALDLLAGEKFINTALAKHKDVSSFFKQICMHLKQKQKSSLASDYFVRAMMLYCVNNEETLRAYVACGGKGHHHSGSNNHSYGNLQTIVERLGDIVHSRNGEFSCETRAACVYIISRIKPDYWENFGMKKRTNSSSSLSRKISLSIKSPSMLDFSPKHRDRTYTIPESQKTQKDGLDENLKESVKKMFRNNSKKSWSQKESYVAKSQSKYDFNSSSLDISETNAPEITYLFELVESFLDGDKPDMIQSVTMVSKVILERGQGRALIELLKKENVFQRIRCYFEKKYPEFEITHSYVSEPGDEIMQLSFCLGLYFQLATQNFDLTRDLIEAEPQCFEQLAGNLYSQAVTWTTDENFEEQLTKTDQYLVLFMAHITSLIITTVDFINSKFVEKLEFGEQIVEESENEITLEVPDQIKITDLDDNSAADTQNN